MNLILNIDAYKALHYSHYPSDISYISSYIESRGGIFDKTIMFGLQSFLIKYLSKKITKEDIDQAQEVFLTQNWKFNKDAWLYILEKHGGYLPLKIEAVKEGNLVENKNVLVQVVNTDPKCFFLTNYIETALLRAVWYGSCVATLSFNLKKVIYKYLKETSEDTKNIENMLQDFGARSVSSYESNQIGASAHLINFNKSASVCATLFLKEFYNESLALYSSPSTEHSAVVSWQQENECKAYEHIYKDMASFSNGFSIVSDSYNLWSALENIWGDKLKDMVIKSGKTLAVRPDSGDPVATSLKTIQILMEKFGFTLNSKGYKVLPSYLKVVYGDGINIKSIENILKTLKQNQISASNILFGMGGALLQSVSRDDLAFAMKVSAVYKNNKWVGVAKNPIDAKNKASKKGVLALVKQNGAYKTINKQDLNGQENMLVKVFENGELFNKVSFQEVKQNALKAFLQEVKD